MQKVMVQIDWFTKIILTLIVVLLAGLLARPYIEPRVADADEFQYIDGALDVYVSGSLDIRGGLETYLPSSFDVNISGVESIYNTKGSPFWVEIK